MDGKVIWLRDTHNTATVEWYITTGKAAEGVTSIREEWVAVPVRSSRDTGFAPPRDKQ